jgi:hypothetical protein
LVSAPSAISPAIDATMETSSSSAGASGGRIEGSRAASIDLPAPGGPTISILGGQCLSHRLVQDNSPASV